MPVTPPSAYPVDGVVKLLRLKGQGWYVRPGWLRWIPKMPAPFQCTRPPPSFTKMEITEYSPNFFGDIMKKCWHMNPKKRPTFSQLAEIIENYIESLVSLDYMNGLESENDLIDVTST
jgi:hypothetical protein